MLLRRLTVVCTGVIVFAVAFPIAALAQQPSGKETVRDDRVIAGSPKDSMEVRHLVLKGSNEDIGRALAKLAAERYQVKPMPSEQRLTTGAQRRYIEKQFPILHERMRGVASAFGKRLDDDAWNHSGLGFMNLRAGCSVFYLPAKYTTRGTGIVSRDYDFTTGGMFGPLQPGTLHPTARPYLVELHPDRGYASVAMVAYDLLSGVLDGMNSEGLTVALLADDELMARYPMEPTAGPAVGLGVLQTARLLLDTCGSVAEAKEALLQTKQYYEFIPVHYLIADRFGNAFIWEFSHAHNKGYIIENPDRPLVTTNFSLHRYLSKSLPPSAEQAKKVCPRYCTLMEQLGDHPGKMSEEFIKTTHRQVDAARPTVAGKRPPERTFWHALYYPEERRVQVSYYLRDEPVASEPNRVNIVRSDYVEFQLAKTETVKAPRP
jgi:hypothetical protein